MDKLHGGAKRVLIPFLEPEIDRWLKLDSNHLREGFKGGERLFHLKQEVGGNILRKDCLAFFSGKDQVLFHIGRWREHFSEETEEKGLAYFFLSVLD